MCCTPSSHLFAIPDSGWRSPQPTVVIIAMARVDERAERDPHCGALLTDVSLASPRDVLGKLVGCAVRTLLYHLGIFNIRAARRVSD